MVSIFFGCMSRKRGKKRRRNEKDNILKVLLEFLSFYIDLDTLVLVGMVSKF